jgi:hypothetical protein
VDLFEKERAAYSHLQHFGVESCVLACYGWAKITPKSFASERKPTCFGPEGSFMKDQRKVGHDSHLPTILRSRRSSVLYTWDTPGDKEMADMDIDFRPPSVAESWYWKLETDRRSSDAYWVPTGDELTYSRHALLLEYLPNADRFQSHILTEKIALNALGGLQMIQKALVEHDDHDDMISRNLLVTKDGRVVFLDFDRAEVFTSVDADTLCLFKQDILQFHLIVFNWMVMIFISYQKHALLMLAAHGQEGRQAK